MGDDNPDKLDGSLNQQGNEELVELPPSHSTGSCIGIPASCPIESSPQPSLQSLHSLPEPGNDDDDLENEPPP